MVNETVSVLKAALGRWVCRKDASSHPGLLTNADLHDLAVATRAGMSEPASPEGRREWGDLRELTKNWLVQQKLGVEPGPLQVHDFEHLATLISPEHPVSTPSPVVPDPVSPPEPSESGLSCQSDVELWTHEAAELSFAREHLERCL
ncbi:hypothetical protein [Gluconobacter sp.]|uniref:hypothetical protein n=1 Tax=Gluconobacter sp. TaxID=1876758 RepID=UPI0039EBEF32